MTTRDEQEALYADIYSRLTPEQKRLADDISKRADDNSNQQLHWAEELLALVDVLVTPSEDSHPWPVVRLFWVRLHGVVTEMVASNRTLAELAKTMTEERLAKNLAKFSLAIFEEATAVLQSLDAREAVVADYLRQRVAHLRQHGYALRQNKTGDILDQREVKQLGKAFAIEDVDRIRSEVLDAHGSEASFAAHLARKVRPAVVRLVAVLRDLHALPSWHEP